MSERYSYFQHTHFSRFTRKELQQGSRHRQSSVGAAARCWSAPGRAARPRLRRARAGAPRRAQSVPGPVPRFLRLTARRFSSARKAGSEHRLLRTQSPPRALARRHLFTERTATCTCTCKAGAGARGSQRALLICQWPRCQCTWKPKCL